MKKLLRISAAILSIIMVFGMTACKDSGEAEYESYWVEEEIIVSGSSDKENSSKDDDSEKDSSSDKEDSGNNSDSDSGSDKTDSSEKDDSDGKKDNSDSKDDDSDGKKDNSNSKDDDSDGKKENSGSKKDDSDDKKEEDDKTSSIEKGENDKNAENLDDIENPVDTDADTDLKGKTITISYWGEDGTSYLINPAASESSYANHQKMVKEIEEKYNCKIDYYFIENSVQYYEKFATAAMAGTKFADIVQQGTAEAFPNQMKSGFWHQLDDYIDIDDIAWNATLMDQIAVDGKHYLAIRANEYNLPSVLFYNEALFEKYNDGKTPMDYYLDNNWTRSTFLELAKKMTRTEGGVKYYGFAAVKAQAKCFTRGGAVKYENGKYVFNMGSSEYIEGLDFMYKLYNDYKYMPTFDNALSEFNGGRVAMMPMALYDNDKIEAIGDDNLRFTRLPKFDKSEEYSDTMMSIASYGIPSTVKNPEVVAQIMYDFLYPYKWRPTIEDNLANYCNTDEELTLINDIIMNAIETGGLTARYDLIDKKYGAGGFGIDEKQSPQAYIASIAKECQDELDQVWGQ